MEHTEYSPEEIKLASEIASTLHDPEAFSIYLGFARKYSEEFLRSRLNRVMKVEASKIRTSRGALFMFLIKQGSP